MAYSDLDTEELLHHLWIANNIMSNSRKMLKNPRCEQHKLEAENRLTRNKLKFDLITVELVFRTTFQDLDTLCYEQRIDNLNLKR